MVKPEVDVVNTVSELTQPKVKGNQLWTNDRKASGKFKSWSEGGMMYIQVVRRIIMKQRDDSKLRDFEYHLCVRFGDVKRSEKVSVCQYVEDWSDDDEGG